MGNSVVTQRCQVSQPKENGPPEGRRTAQAGLSGPCQERLFRGGGGGFIVGHRMGRH